MSEIQRYDDVKGGLNVAYPSSEGRFILYTDHEAALAAEVKRREEVEAQFEIANEEVALKCKDCNRHGAFEENVALRRYVDELTATNERMRKALEKYEKFHNEHQAAVFEILLADEHLKKMTIAQAAKETDHGPK